MKARGILQGCENSQPANFVGCEFSQVAKFRRLRNFATLLPSAVDCFLTCFLFGFVQLFPLCIFGSFIHFCNFLILSTYISSVLLVNQSVLHSINQSIKLVMKLPPPRLLVIFYSFSFTSSFSHYPNTP